MRKVKNLSGLETSVVTSASGRWLWYLYKYTHIAFIIGVLAGHRSYYHAHDEECMNEVVADVKSNAFDDLVHE